MNAKCLIVDDEHLALRLLEDYVTKLSGVDVVAKCDNAASALEHLQSEEVDILFLDIQMPDLTGLELLRTLRNKPQVILTTAYSEYALQGYDLDVTDYLLKPISFERFVQAVNKALDQIELQRKALAGGPKEDREQLFVKSGNKRVKLYLDEVLYIEGMREYVSFYTPTERIITLESMKNLEKSLPENFIRVHKSYIIAIDKVKSVGSNALEINKKKIPIGKSYRHNLDGLFQ